MLLNYVDIMAVMVLMIDKRPTKLMRQRNVTHIHHQVHSVWLYN